MVREAVTPAGIRRESEFDAIADEVSARTTQWIGQLRRGDNSAARLEAILHGMGCAMLEILVAHDFDTMPEHWAGILSRYLEENFDDEEPGTDAQQGAGKTAEAADQTSKGRPQKGGLVDKGGAVDGRHQEPGNVPGSPGKLRQGKAAASDAPGRKK